MNTNIPETLKIRRYELCLSQKEFAKKIGVSICSYFHWEKGSKLPGWEFIPKICNLVEKEIHIDQNGVLFCEKTSIEKKPYSSFLDGLNESIWMRGLTVPKMNKKNAIGMWRGKRCCPSIPVLMDVLKQLNCKIILSGNGFKFLLL